MKLKAPKIVVCITGGIAAYKVITMVNRMVKLGCEVQIMMTETATKFVSPMVLKTMTKREVIMELTDDGQDTDIISHIHYAQEWDAIAVVPATANCIGKAANGIADDVVTSTIIAASKPILFVPSMNTVMYENPIVQENIQKLKKRGYRIVEPACGHLACGTTGKGKLPEPESIINEIMDMIDGDKKEQATDMQEVPEIENKEVCTMEKYPDNAESMLKTDRKGKTVVITAGGTSEPIDQVRKITNSGTGKLGSIIATTFLASDDIENVIYIHTKKAYMPSDTSEGYEKLQAVMADSTMEVLNAVRTVLKENKVDIFIHSMAISDYFVNYVTTPEKLCNGLAHKNEEKHVPNIDIFESPYEGMVIDNGSKISSDMEQLLVVLSKTPKIISVIKKESPDTLLVGFKLLENVEESELISAAVAQIDKSGCDYVVANDIKDISATQHKALIIDEAGRVISRPGTKEEIASKIFALTSTKKSD